MSKVEGHRPKRVEDPLSPRPPPPVLPSSAHSAPPLPPAAVGPPPPFLGGGDGPLAMPTMSADTPQPAAPFTPAASPLPSQIQPFPALRQAIPRPAQPTAPRTTPYTVAPGATPIMVPQLAAPVLTPPTIAAADTEEPPFDISEEAARTVPSFLVSMLVHMLVVIGLALFSFGSAQPGQIQIEAVYAEALGKQLLSDTLQSPESLDMKVEVPALSFGLKPVDDPLAAPPNLPDFFADPNRATSQLEAPSIGLALTGREAGMKRALLPAYGGTATTEASVLAGLEWLKKHQKSDGGWSLVGPYPDGALMEDRCAATALALLAFQGYGATNKAGATSPDFHDVVERGWNFLLKMQDKDGFFVHEGTHQSRAYAQAQASIAICEIYGMTKDPKFKKPAQLALDFAHKAQSPELGGWRYEPRIDSDMSVTGWYVMALQSGRMAGLEVQSPTLDSISKFLDRVALEGGTQYSYQIGGKPSLTMTAEALLCRQYLGWKHDDPRMRAGIDQLLANRVNYNDDQNVYYWYYATQACHHMDGDDWDRWNEAMRQAIPAAQTKTGGDRGSWSSAGDRWGSHGGRLYVTCLSVFMLETYYRHLPIYKWRLQ
jgi:hypothetical protein